MQGSPQDSPALHDHPPWEARLDHDGRVCAYTRFASGMGWLHLPGLALYRFAPGEGLIEAFPEAGVSLQSLERAYQQIVLPMALQADRYEVLHASAVRDARGVHVFCGASRAGKSTVAAGLRRRGLEVWADDAVAFTARRSAITAVPLPFALRLRSDVAQFFNERADVRDSKGKTETLRYQSSAPLPIATVSLLERGSALAITRLRASEALPAVLYHSFYFSLDDSPGSVRRRMAGAFLDLVASVPIFRVSLRLGLDGVESLLNHLGQRVLAGVDARSAA